MDFSTLFLLSLKPSAGDLSLTWIWMSLRLITFYSELAQERGDLRHYRRSPKVEEIYFKISIPWSVSVLMNFCQCISPKAVFGRLNWMPRSMVMRSAKFYSIFCLFRQTYPSVGLGQQHTYLGALTKTHGGTEACILTLPFLDEGVSFWLETRHRYHQQLLKLS